MSYEAHVTAHWAGMFVLIIGVIWCNVAVSRMARAIGRAGGWQGKMNMRQLRSLVQKYRAKHANAPLCRDLKIGYWIAGLGAAIYFSEMLIS